MTVFLLLNSLIFSSMELVLKNEMNASAEAVEEPQEICTTFA